MAYKPTRISGREVVPPNGLILLDATDHHKRLVRATGLLGSRHFAQDLNQTQALLQAESGAGHAEQSCDTC